MSFEIQILMFISLFLVVFVVLIRVVFEVIIDNTCFYLIWLGCFIVGSQYCDSYHIFLLLIVNSFVSMFVILTSYGTGGLILIVLVINFISELFLYTCYGFYLKLQYESFLFMGVVYLAYGEITVNVLLGVLMVYSLVGVVGFWIYWAMETSYFISIYLHSSGFVVLGCLIFNNVLFLGVFDGYVKYINCIGAIIIVSYFCFIIFFMMLNDVKKAFGFFSASSICYLFLLALLNPLWFNVYFLVSSLVNIFIFQLLYMGNSKVWVYFNGWVFLVYFFLIFILFLVGGSYCFFDLFNKMPNGVSCGGGYSILEFIYFLNSLNSFLFFMSILLQNTNSVSGFCLFFINEGGVNSFIGLLFIIFLCFFFIFGSIYGMFGGFNIMSLGFVLFYLEFLLVLEDWSEVCYTIKLEYIWNSCLFYFYVFLYCLYNSSEYCVESNWVDEFCFNYLWSNNNELEDNSKSLLIGVVLDVHMFIFVFLLGIFIWLLFFSF